MNEIFLMERPYVTSNTVKERYKSSIPINLPDIDKNNDSHCRNYEKTLD